MNLDDFCDHSIVYVNGKGKNGEGKEVDLARCIKCPAQLTMGDLYQKTEYEWAEGENMFPVYIRKPPVVKTSEV